MSTQKGANATVGLNAVVVTIVGDAPRVLVVDDPSGRPALPYGPLDPREDRTLERGLRRWVSERTQLQLGYVEQLYTFGDRTRDAQDARSRNVSVGYVALVRDGAVAPGATWHDWYDFFPWEDRRARVTPSGAIVERLRAWAQSARAAAERALRIERITLLFGTGTVPWNGLLSLERYELMYEAGLVAEAYHDERRKVPRTTLFGTAMALDHRRMLATAIARLRGKITYRPLVFEVLAPEFTLLQLQRTVEALAGRRLHKANFRRLVSSAGLVEATGTTHRATGGRPADRYRFREAVLLERPAPGLRIGR